MSWSTVRADQFCTLITDGTHDSPKPQQSGWKLITSKHLKGHYIDFDSANWISEADYLKVISRSAVEQWDILFSMIGTIGNIYLEKNPHVEYACKNMGIFKFSGNKENALWMYYYLKSPQAKAYIQTHLRGSTQAYVPLGGLREMPVPVPPQSVRNEIIAVLRPIDEKIECNNAINDNLQQQAAALFESWFVNYDPWDGVQPSEWENAPLGSFVEIKRGGSPRPIQDFLSDSGLRWLKISDVTSLSSPFVLEIKEHIKEEGLRKTVFLHAGELVLSNSATPGIPKILDVDTCIHDGWLYFPKSELSKYYLYLFFKHIRKELVALGNGSVFTNLKTDILKAFPATKADESTLKEFDALVTPLFDAMLNADRENFKLAAMRDALLPKLMSSEIDVSEVEL